MVPQGYRATDEQGQGGRWGGVSRRQVRQRAGDVAVKGSDGPDEGESRVRAGGEWFLDCSSRCYWLLPAYLAEFPQLYRDLQGLTPTVDKKPRLQKETLGAVRPRGFRSGGLTAAASWLLLPRR